MLQAALLTDLNFNLIGPLTEELLTHVLHWYSALPIMGHWQEHIQRRVLALNRRKFPKLKKIVP